MARWHTTGASCVCVSERRIDQTRDVAHGELGELGGGGHVARGRTRGAVFLSEVRSSPVAGGRAAASDERRAVPGRDQPLPHACALSVARRVAPPRRLCLRRRAHARQRSRCRRHASPHSAVASRRLSRVRQRAAPRRRAPRQRSSALRRRLTRPPAAAPPGIGALVPLVRIRLAPPAACASHPVDLARSVERQHGMSPSAELAARSAAAQARADSTTAAVADPQLPSCRSWLSLHWTSVPPSAGAARDVRRRRLVLRPRGVVALVAAIACGVRRERLG